LYSSLSLHDALPISADDVDAPFPGAVGIRSNTARRLVLRPLLAGEIRDALPMLPPRPVRTVEHIGPRREPPSVIDRYDPRSSADGLDVVRMQARPAGQNRHGLPFPRETSPALQPPPSP